MNISDAIVCIDKKLLEIKTCRKQYKNKQNQDKKRFIVAEKRMNDLKYEIYMKAKESKITTEQICSTWGFRKSTVTRIKKKLLKKAQKEYKLKRL